MKRLVPFCWDTINMIVKPVLLLLVSIGVYLAFSQACVWLKELPLFIMTTVQILFLSFSYMGLLLLFHKSGPCLRARDRFFHRKQYLFSTFFSRVIFFHIIAEDVRQYIRLIYLEYRLIIMIQTEGGGVDSEQRLIFLRLQISVDFAAPHRGV